MPQNPQTHRSSPALIAAWACFLASSWTWCIGMFLPVILIRDFGFWAFLVFALPNCLGAAAVGWVFARGGASEAFVARHRPMMECFSLVTLLFQVFFAAWVLMTCEPEWKPLVAIFAGGLALGTFVRRLAPVLGVTVYAASLFLGTWWLVDSPPNWDRLSWGTPEQIGNLLWLAPVIAFGFVFCPLLDLTFHHARSRMDERASRPAFGIAFGLLFPMMIGLTAAYAFDPGLTSSSRTTPWSPGLPGPLILIHVVLQLGFTSGVHVQRLAEPGRRLPAWSLVASVFLVIPVMVLGGGVLLDAWGAERLRGFEGMYRLFMAMYGLVFPAYVWICVLPRAREDGQGPTRRAFLVWLAACVIAGPMFWMGFLRDEYWWLAPGLGVVLLMRWLGGAQGRQPRAADAARS